MAAIAMTTTTRTTTTTPPTTETRVTTPTTSDHAAADHGAAERLDAADYDDHGAADDTPDYKVRHDDDPERVDAADAADYGGDDRLLMEAAVDDRLLLDDPAVHESASSDSVRRMKRGRGFQARARRDGPWIPPDLRRFGQPVFLAGG